MTSSRSTGRGRGTSSSTSCSTPASSTPATISTSKSSTRRRRPKTSSAASRCITGRRERRGAARAADALVSQHVVLGGRRTQAAAHSRRRGRIPSSAPSITSSAPSTSTRNSRPTLLFCENETNAPRVFGERAATRAFPRTASATTSCTARTRSTRTARGPRRRRTSGSMCPAGGQATVAVRLSREAPASLGDPFAGATELFEERRREADEFYEAITPPVGDR